MAVGYFLAVPLYQEYQTQQINVLNKQEELNNQIEYFQKIEEFHQQLEEAGWEDLQERISVNFSTEPYFFPKMYSFFKQKAITHGMALNDISYSDPIDLKAGSASEQTVTEGESSMHQAYSGLENSVKKITFSLALSGSYNSFKNFLADLENQMQLVSVESISFSSASAQSSSDETQSSGFPFRVVLNTYSY